jgi:hypothetical protein
MRFALAILFLLLVVGLAIASHRSTAAPLQDGTPVPTATAQPTRTSTHTPAPTDTAILPTPLPPTVTPLPTATALPTNTPIPTATLDPSVPRTDTESRIACNMSERFVEQQLKSPSTAKFPNAFDYMNGEGCMALYNNGVWSISSWVDLQNSFGAMIRSHYVAQLTYDKQEETWYLQDLVFVD